MASEMIKQKRNQSKLLSWQKKLNIYEDAKTQSYMQVGVKHGLTPSRIGQILEEVEQGVGKPEA